MSQIVNSNFGGPVKPPNSWGAVSLGVSASAATPAIQSMADAAATIGIPVLQIALLLVSIGLAFLGKKQDSDDLKQVLREVVLDMRREWTAQRIAEYRHKYRKTQRSRQKRHGDYRI